MIGISVKWLRDNLQIIKDVTESTDIAQSVGETGEVYFVPAFSGLYAPYWRKEARRYFCFLDQMFNNHLNKLNSSIYVT
ncbi:hypothetical protein NQ314_015505 [Rhamnusium bicolor]|uniref:Carbohydrate kinase FGGY N-terminal domain-containing protein n=1 Tax=Rhamnusium bicolor TaxID=1586634 RepID=A0AAV8WYS4_9CUCU|nr:hypothetical protein NQ314_015505 [Rhamnusium bicolor]